MELSKTQLCLRLLVALLLPLYIRTTTVYGFFLAFIIIAIVLRVAHKAGKPIDLHLTKRFVQSMLATLIAKFIADFTVVGPWIRLGMTHLRTWEVPLQMVSPKLVTEHCDQVRARRFAGWKSLLVALPLLHAAIVTIYINRKGYLNTSDSQYIAVGYGVVVCHAIFDPMQCLTVVIWRFLTRSFPALVKGPMIPKSPDDHSQGKYTEPEEMYDPGPAFPEASKRAIQIVSKEFGRPRMTRSVTV